MKSSYPFKAETLPSKGMDWWWPVSSHPDDDMLVGDGIPGDKMSATLAARCSNLAYHTAIVETIDYINSTNEAVTIDVGKAVQALIRDK